MENKILQSTYQVRFQDSDPFRHLNNARYLDYFVNAREDQNTLRVTIIFSIKDSRTPVELSFNVERIR